MSIATKDQVGLTNGQKKDGEMEEVEEEMTEVSGSSSGSDVIGVKERKEKLKREEAKCL